MVVNKETGSVVPINDLYPFVTPIAKLVLIEPGFSDEPRYREKNLTFRPCKEQDLDETLF